MGQARCLQKIFFRFIKWARLIDGCNFSNNTLWEGTIKNSEYGYTPGKTGHQYILDGTNLNGIESNRYDFLLSCHNLEHIANPLRAIQEWVRVLKPGGQLLLILPDKRFTFDRKRAYTHFEHLVQDFNMNTGEDDLTHLPEILQLHDLRLDPGAGRDFEVFKKRGEQNPENRGLHHHVFSGELLKTSLAYFQVNTLAQYFLPPFHQIIIGQK